MNTFSDSFCVILIVGAVAAAAASAPLAVDGDDRDDGVGGALAAAADTDGRAVATYHRASSFRIFTLFISIEFSFIFGWFLVLFCFRTTVLYCLRPHNLSTLCCSIFNWINHGNWILSMLKTNKTPANFISSHTRTHNWWSWNLCSAINVDSIGGECACGRKHANTLAKTRTHAHTHTHINFACN